MFRKKYSNFLSILLIVAIIAVIIGIIIIGVKFYKKYKINADAENAEIEFVKSDKNTNNDDSDVALDEEIKLDEEIEGSTNTSTKRAVKYYKNFIMIGYIEIPSISLKYPILETESASSLEVSVAVRYPNNATLNSEGNVVIAGHNYRNGTFFSNLKNIKKGDKISIKDLNGDELIYIVYNIYETTPEDSTYVTRDVGNNKEITLVTCTDDSKARTIVCAKAE